MTNVLERLSYGDLTVDEFGHSNIPDNNLFTAWVAGTSPREVKYTFVFVPKKSSGVKRSYIKVDGEREQASKRPEIYKANSSGIEEVLEGLKKIAKGKKELQHLLSSEIDREDTGFISKPKSKMTQKGIAEVARRIDDELKFGNVAISHAYYRDVIPLNPSSESFGFNLPSQKIIEKLLAEK